MLKDTKEGTRGGRKPDTTHVRSSFLTYTARPSEYGDDKYERANYLRPTGDAIHTTPTKADVDRFRNYLRAGMDHARKALDAIERHQALDPHFEDIAGLRRAAYAVDTDETPGNPIGPSLLPHVAPACSSYMMAIEQAVNCGLLPVDPGQPWRSNAEVIIARYCDGDEAEVFHRRPAPVAPAPTPPTEPRASAGFAELRHGGQSVPRAESCRSSECAIRNRCTGYAWCPHTRDPKTGVMTPLTELPDHVPGPIAAYIKEEHARLQTMADDVGKTLDAERFASIEANVEKLKEDAAALAEQKRKHDEQMAAWAKRCRTCYDDPRGELIDCAGSAGYRRCTACGGKDKE